MERECRDPTVRCFFIWFRSCCVIVFRFANLHAHAYFCCAEYGYKFHSKNWQGSWSKGLSLLVILLVTFFLQQCMFVSWCCMQFTMCLKDLKIPHQILDQFFLTYCMCQQVIRRLAQNREAARKSRLRKKVMSGHQLDYADSSSCQRWLQIKQVNDS